MVVLHSFGDIMPLTLRKVLSRVLRISGNLGLLLLSAFVCLILLELTLRIFYPIYDPAGKLTYSINKDGVPLAPKNWVGRQWKNTGDYNVEVRINKYGLRDIRDIRQSTAEDIFVVGDSFSMGHGVAENIRYSSLLDSMLKQNLYNISIPTALDGYDRLLGYASDQGATLRNLIIGVCMENDLGYYDIAPKNQQDSPVSFNQSVSRVSLWAYLKFYLAQYSAVYTAIAAVAHQNENLKLMAEAMGFIIPNFSGMPRQSYSIELVTGTVQRLNRLVTDHKISNVIVLVIPSRALWIGGDEIEHTRIHDQFIQELERSERKTIVDMRPYFERTGDPLSFYFKNDGHWNNKGHRKAAEMIYQAITGRSHAK